MDTVKNPTMQRTDPTPKNNLTQISTYRDFWGWESPAQTKDIPSKNQITFHRNKVSENGQCYPPKSPLQRAIWKDAGFHREKILMTVRFPAGLDIVPIFTGSLWMLYICKIGNNRLLCRINTAIWVLMGALTHSASFQQHHPLTFETSKIEGNIW